jgi:hypothetical protein
MHCRLCGDPLERAPSGIDTCDKWCDWLASQCAGFLRAPDSNELVLFDVLRELRLACQVRQDSPAELD